MNNQEYIETKDKIHQAISDRDVFVTRCDLEIEKITDFYKQKINKLEKMRDLKEQELKSKRDDFKKSQDVTINTLHDSLKDTDRQIEFLKAKDEIGDGNVEFDKSTVKPRNSNTLVWLNDLRKEKYLNLVLLIAENDRPKNRYSLAVIGLCPLLRFIPGYWNSYCNLKLDYHSVPIERDIRQASTVEELQTWAKTHKDTIFSDFLTIFDEVKKAYIKTISYHQLSDFDPILSIRNLTDEQAPVICKITEYEKTKILRLYNSEYYQECEIPKDDFDPFDYIEIDGVIYHRLCRKELMGITHNGNTLFGHWYSIGIESRCSYHSYTSVFNKSNLEKEIADSTKSLKKRLKKYFKDVDFSYPVVEWVHPELIEGEG